MSDILAVEKGLPPGLWLPLPEEPTEKFLKENFDHGHNTHDDIIEFGIFVTALAVLGADDTGRESFMPRYGDMGDLYEAGYGLHPKRWSENYNGLRNRQAELGFYPAGLVPDERTLLKRLQWLVRYSLNLSSDVPRQADVMAPILAWGAKRHLLPSQAVCRMVLGYDTAEARKIIGVGKLDTLKQHSKQDVYRFGARVLQKHGRPPAQRQLDQMYGDEFCGKPYSVIKAYFGKYNTFWSEFGIFTESSGLTKEDLLTAGLRQTLDNGVDSLSMKEVDRLSAAGKFPSMFPIKRHFKGIEPFREALVQEREKMEKTLSILTTAGVRPSLVNAVRSQYIVDPLFNENILNHTTTLVTSSKIPKHTDYIATIIKNGFDLLDQETYDMQFNDFVNSLSRTCINLPQERRFMFELVPRLDVAAAMDKTNALR